MPLLKTHAPTRLGQNEEDSKIADDEKENHKKPKVFGFMAT